MYTEREVEEDSEVRKPTDSRKNHLEYCKEVLKHLLNFTVVPYPQPSTPKEWAEWKEDQIKRLSTIPVWKLKELDSFTGKYITEIWGFFDQLRKKDEVFVAPKQLPEPKTQVAKCVSCLMDHILKDKRGTFTEKEKDELERVWVGVMKVKFPRANWQLGRKANRM